MTPLETPSGLFIASEELTIFWGKRDTSLRTLQAEFPHLRFARIHQVHGDRTVRAPAPEGTQADAHETDERGLALVVVTADCLPVMVHDPRTGWIAGLHAGWRGVANRIVPKALAEARTRGIRGSDLRVWIGPHIGFRSFGVQEDVRDELLASVSGRPLESFWRVLPGADRFLVDLEGLMRAQLEEMGVPRANVAVASIDTMTDPRFHSHRRDRERAGRNLSFIARLP